MSQGTFKNYQGGLKDYKRVRKRVEIFDEPTKPPCFNPYHVITTYMGMLPRGWTEPTKKNPIFLTPNKSIQNGIGFRSVPRGRNILSQFFQRATNMIGVDGKFTNQQVRSVFINSAIETGMTDNQITAVTGHRNADGLKPYKDASLLFKKENRARMVDSAMAGRGE